MKTSDAEWNLAIREKAGQFAAAKGRAESAMVRALQFNAQKGVLSAELARVRAEIAKRGGKPAGGSSFSAGGSRTPTRPLVGGGGRRERVETPRVTQFTAGLPTLEEACRMDPSELARLGLLSFHVTG